MSDELNHIAALAYAAAGGVASWFATKRGSKGRLERLSAVEEKVELILKSPAVTWTQEQLEQSVRRIHRAVADEGLNRNLLGSGTFANADGVSKFVAECVQRELSPIRGDISALEAAVGELRAALATCASQEDLASLVDRQSGKWEEVQRTLGVIEGKLGTVRDQLTLHPGRGPSRGR